MKKIEAFVPWRTVKNIKNKLVETFKEAVSKGERSEGYPGMTVSDVKGKGLGHPNVHEWGGKKFKVDLFPKTKIEIIVVDEDVEKVISAIVGGVKESGLNIKHQGKIFVFNIEDAIKIRDGTRGEEAVK